MTLQSKSSITGPYSRLEVPDALLDATAVRIDSIALLEFPQQRKSRVIFLLAAFFLP